MTTSGGLVAVPCFRRLRCSIKGTAGELDNGTLLEICWAVVHKLDCDGHVTSDGSGCNGRPTTSVNLPSSANGKTLLVAVL